MPAGVDIGGAVSLAVITAGEDGVDHPAGEGIGVGESSAGAPQAVLVEGGACSVGAAHLVPVFHAPVPVLAQVADGRVAAVKDMTFLK